jgi:hypothetical protein
MSLRRSRTLVLIGTAAGGTLVGHLLAYVATIPNDSARAELLRHSAHGYLPGAAAAATLTALSAIAATVAVGIRRDRGTGGSGAGHPSTALHLWLMQCTAFVAMEGIERMAAGAGLSILSPRLLLVGVLSQALVAVAGALVLSGADRVAEAVTLVPSSVAWPRRAILVGSDLPGRRIARSWLLLARPSRAPPFAVGR